MDWYLQAELIGRVMIAAICGGAIGYERKNRLKEAGLRTHLIVALGASLMMIISKYGFSDIINGTSIRLDPSRVASCIITGVGFLGAGTIFVRKQIINGLTTAAGLWATAGLGMAIGSGMYIIGIASTVILVLSQIFLHKNLRFLHLPESDLIVMQIVDVENSISKVKEILAENNILVHSVKVEKTAPNFATIEAFVKLPSKFTPTNMMEVISKYDFIKSIEC
jgi:Uncharacterized membrane protein